MARSMKRMAIGVGAAMMMLSLPACQVGTAVAQEPPAPVAPLAWVTLGTNGGPVASSDRAQPANLLIADGQYWLVDVGDGVSDQLAEANVSPLALSGVVISHLHPDHFGGLAALIARRWFLRTAEPLTIYGPPGTQAHVEGILAALVPAEQVGLGLVRNNIPPAAGTVRVVTVRGGDIIRLGRVTVTAVENTHFDPRAETGSQSLSFRFDLGDRSIGYTGDTGPSAAVATAFADVDLLVAEVIDMPSMIAQLDRDFAAMPQAQREAVIEHLRTHHLPPADVARLANQANAGSVVLTHVVSDGEGEAIVRRIEDGVRADYAGEVTIANDLDRF